MKIKTYRATDRTTALKQIREELGPEAVIVYERRLHAGAPGLFGLAGLLSLFGRSPKPEIEILAAVEDENLPGGPSSFPPRSVGEGHSLAGHLASDQRTAARPAMISPLPAPAAGIAGGAGIARGTASVGEVGSGVGSVDRAGRSVLPTPATPSHTVSRGESVGHTEASGAAGAAGAAGEERRKMPASEPAGHRSAAASPALERRRARPTSPSSRSPAGRAVLYEMQRTLTDLRGAVNRLTWQAPDLQLAGESPVLRAASQHLVAQEVEPTLALSLMAQLSEETGGRGEPEPELVRGRLIELLGERVRTAKLAPPGGAPLVIFLIGPTGVGKTTTLAKLAAHLSFAQGKQVGLVTTDTFRIAATSQLATYAEIMRLPIEVIYRPAELASVVERYRHADLLLVDTPGCAQGNETQLAELARFLAAVPAAQRLVLLVLAAPTKFRDLVDVEERFGRLGPDGLILTKLDETSTYGPVVSVVVRSGRPVYFTTSGQNVPSDIEAASSQQLVQLVIDGLFATAARAGVAPVGSAAVAGVHGGGLEDGRAAHRAEEEARSAAVPGANGGGAKVPANGTAGVAANGAKRSSSRPPRGAAPRRRRLVEGGVE